MCKYKECLALETLLSKVSPLPSTFLLKLRLPSTSDTQLLVIDLDLSVELGEGRERHAPRRLATNIFSCFGIVRVIPLARVQMGDPRFKIWGVSVEEIFYHSPGHVVAELLDLLPDVFQESVAGPASDHHDHIDCYLVQKHGHRGSGTQGVRSYF